MSSRPSAFLLPLLGVFTAGGIEAQIAPQAGLSAPPPCAHVRPDERSGPEPTPAWRRKFERATLPGSQLPWRTESGPCSRPQWAALTGPALAEAVATSSKECLTELWTYDANTAQVVAAANVEAVAAEILIGSSEPVGNAVRLERLCLFLQIAFFHEFYEAGTDYSASTEDAAREAMVTLGHRPELLTASHGMPSLRKQWTVSMDSTNSTLECLGPLEAILARFRADRGLVSVYEEALAIYYCLFSLQRQIHNASIAHGASSPWVGAVSVSLAGEVRALAVDVDPDPLREPLTNNALWTLGHFSYLDAPTSEDGRAGTSDAYRLQPTTSGPWLWSIRTLEVFYGATLDTGIELDLATIRAQVRAVALPNREVFDEGKLIFETALPASAVQALYAATKEVAAQFFRKCTYLDPVPGDVHDVLSVVIYASPEDYDRYQGFLFGTPTNNGGIYLEHLALLCTFDRTPADSIYTLEELLRHEYTHYLDGRFDVGGDFYGPDTLYEGGRIDSHVEGLAEFMAGSTRTHGVLSRRKLVQLIQSDPVRMSVADILAATYSQGFAFYPYSGLFYAYLDEERPDLLWSTFQVLRGDDPAALEFLEASLASDAALQTGFDAWLDASISQVDLGQGLFAEDVPTELSPANLPGDNADDVLADLTSVLPGAVFRTWDGRYRHEGALTLVTTGLAPSEQRVLFDERLDAVLDELRPLGPNFTSAVAWCGDIVYGGDSATAAFVIEGPYDADVAGGGVGGGCSAAIDARGVEHGDPALALCLVLVLVLAAARSARRVDAAPGSFGA